MSNAIEREIISDIRHSADVDNYSNDQRKFLWSVAERLETLQAARAQAVQGEPVSLRQRLFNGWEGCSNHGCVVVDPKPGMMRTNGSCQCVVNASRSQLYMLQGRIQSALSATQQPAEQQPAPDVAGLVEAAEAALEEIEDIMQEAYNSAYPVCCGRAGSECCGSPEPEWEEADQRMMDRLDQHQKALREALAAHRKQGGEE